MARLDEARHNLGNLEDIDGKINQTIKHWTIVATAGHDESMKAMKEGLKLGRVTKDKYEMTLRADIVSVKEMRSGDRDKAAHLRLRR